MLVPDQVRDCACFLYYKAADEALIPAGTAFFVTMPVEGIEDQSFLYLVTAKHVVNGIKFSGCDGRVHVRMNTVAGGFDWHVLDADLFLPNPDETKDDDIAIAGLPLPEGLFTFKSVPLEMFATDEIIERQSIGVGDELFLTGLFWAHRGTKRNIPIVRIGNIAAMPDEPVKTKHMGYLDAYLAETRSIGGLSGSPVFVNVGIDRSEENRSNILLTGSAISSHFYLLGLMHGHWDLDVSEDAVVEDALADEKINMGIGIVLPASKIRDVLDHPNFLVGRSIVTAKLVHDRAPTPDEPESPTSE